MKQPRTVAGTGGKGPEQTVAWFIQKPPVWGTLLINDIAFQLPELLPPYRLRETRVRRDDDPFTEQEREALDCLMSDD